MKNSNITRRDLLKMTAAFGGAFALSNLHQGYALAQSQAPYQALVYIFLAGGNDAFNTLVPLESGSLRTRYESVRRNVAINANELHALNLKSNAQIFGGETYNSFGLHPNCGDLANMFNQGELGIIANVGNLFAPITRQQYLDNEVVVPPQLFSHSDQQRQFQSEPSSPFRFGWGGRCAELMTSFNQAQNLSPLISVAGLNSFQVSLNSEINPYVMQSTGVTNLNGFTNETETMVDAYMSQSAAPVSLMSQKYSDIYRSARTASQIMNTAFDLADSKGVDYDAIFASHNATATSLGLQLKTVAKMIAGREAHTNNRPIFYVRMGGFDTHQNLLADHQLLMTELNDAMAAFKQALVAQQDFDKTLSFVGSEFGRTFTPNGTAEDAGTDHAWGGHAFVMGGMINGGHIFGTHPDLRIGEGLDVDNLRGRWIPSTSIAQSCAPIAKWMGVKDVDLPSVFPTLGNFDSPFEAAANLQFIKG